VRATLGAQVTVRFRRTLKVALGVRINVTKAGVGVLVGPRGLKLSTHATLTNQPLDTPVVDVPPSSAKVSGHARAVGVIGSWRSMMSLAGTPLNRSGS
jgi:hypothetical protein